MYHLINSKRFNQSDTAQLRLQVVEYHIKYGTQATIDAFKISKASIFRWKQTYLDSKKNIYSLIPKSRKPIHYRGTNTDIEVLQFIRDIRVEHTNIGKEKIKPELDTFCMYHHLECISISSIGRILKRLNLISSRKVYHDPNRRHQKKVYKDRVKVSPKSNHYGYLEIDTTQRFVQGIKLYIFNAIDINLRFQFSYTYQSATSGRALDFFKKVQEVYPMEKGIHTVQTDNGSEYFGKFSMYLKSEGIKQVYIYPRCPRINGYIERANRTLKEEFVYSHEDIAYSEGIPEFNRQSMEYLIWFNTTRPHKSLNNLSPIQYMLKFIPESHMYVTHTKD